eukprot:842529_1
MAFVLTTSSCGNIATIKYNLALKPGKWYYETILNTSGVMQIGFIESGFTTPNGAGVGDDKHSWAYDGCRKRKWHAGYKNYATHIKWKKSDVVGCC